LVKSYLNFHHKLEIATLLLCPGWGPAVFYEVTQAELIARNTRPCCNANGDCSCERRKSSTWKIMDIPT